MGWVYNWSWGMIVVLRNCLNLFSCELYLCMCYVIDDCLCDDIMFCVVVYLERLMSCL